MTQEHRDQFLAMEGWQKTERGYFRKDGFQYSEDTGAVRVTHMTQRSRKFRRLPFGRQSKHDALVGWFVLEPEGVLERRGGLRELNEMAERDAKNNEKTVIVEFQILPGKIVLPSRNLPIDWSQNYKDGNKRQGWDKNGEVMG